MPLGVTITPGKKFAAGEKITNAKLNQLAGPTVAITGAVSVGQIDPLAVTVDKTDLDPASAYAQYQRDHGRLPVGDLVRRGPEFDVRAFGDTTIWDGVEDAAPAINRAIAAAIAAGGGTILFPAGDYFLETPGNNTDWIRMLYAKADSNCHLTLKGARGGGTRLFHSLVGTTGEGVTLLHLEGSFQHVVIEDLWFEEAHDAVTADSTEAIVLRDSTGTMQDVRIQGCHFRNFSRAIFSGCKGLRIIENEFSYPHGRPRPLTASENCVGIWLLSSNSGGAEDTQIIGNRMVGTELDGTIPIDGLCCGQSVGWTVRGNLIRRIWTEGILISSRPLANSAAPNWRDAARDIVIADNSIEYDEAVGDGATIQIRMGISVRDARASILGNRILNCYIGINILNGDYAGGDDAGTRMRDFVIAQNAITLAADLKVDDTLDPILNGRVGIQLQAIGEAVVANNQIRWQGRTSPAAVTKYWKCEGIQLVGCDNIVVRDNLVAGALGAASTDKLWLAGISMQACRYCEVSGNRLRNLNIGVNASWVPVIYNPTGNEIGENRMDGVVWPFTSMDGNENGTLNATNNGIIKKATGSGYKSRKQRTSFTAGTNDWIRVAAFLGHPNFRARVWSDENPYPFTLTIEGTYFGGGGGGGTLACLGNTAPLGALVTKARLCTNTDPTSGIIHFDLYVASAQPGQTVWVEIESCGVYEGVWGEPTTPALSRTSFTEASATFMREMDLSTGTGFAVANQLEFLATWDNPMKWRGPGVGMWLWVTSDVDAHEVRYKFGPAPTNDLDGFAWLTP